jgi:chromosome segregation ATPase
LVVDKNRMSGLVADKNHMPTAVARLQLALLDREAQVQELERENFSCRQQVNHAKSALQTLRGEVEAAEAEAATAQARCSELEEENAQLRRALSAADVAAGVSTSSAQAGPGTTSSV